MRKKRTPQEDVDAAMIVFKARNTTIALHIEALAAMAGIGRVATREAVDTLIAAGLVEKVERRAVGLMVRSVAYAYRLRSEDATAQQRS